MSWLNYLTNSTITGLLIRYQNSLVRNTRAEKELQKKGSF